MAKNEDFVLLTNFVYPHEAHLVKAYLESEGLFTEIRDELTIQVNNFFSNAIGGVKLMVKENEYDYGIDLLKKGGYLIDSSQSKEEVIFLKRKENREKDVCPFCRSKNVSQIKSPNILTVLTVFILGAVFPISSKSYKCFECYREWKNK